MCRPPGGGVSGAGCCAPAPPPWEEHREQAESRPGGPHNELLPWEQCGHGRPWHLQDWYTHWFMMLTDASTSNTHTGSYSYTNLLLLCDPGGSVFQVRTPRWGTPVAGRRGSISWIRWRSAPSQATTPWALPSPMWTKTPSSPSVSSLSPRDTPVTPSDTPVTPSDTPVTPSDTPVTPSDTPVTPSDTPVTPRDTPVTPHDTPVTPHDTALTTSDTAVNP